MFKNRFIFILKNVVLVLAYFRCVPGDQCVAHDKRWSFLRKNESCIDWSGLCADGKSQSPIFLSRSEAVKAHFSRFKLNNYRNAFTFSIYNNGHGVSLAVPRLFDITITGGPLHCVYILEDIHWHWNQSEHVMEDENFILEMHLVHRNTRYYSREEAVKYSDGLAVLAVLHKHCPRSSPYVKEIIDTLVNVRYPGDYATMVTPISLRQFLPQNISSYFTYEGSLTTPPCAESVTWIIFTSPLRISYRDLRVFMEASKLSDGSRLERNFRPLQPINSRQVFINKS